MARLSVVICGGGIAGVEALLRLRRLAGDEVDIALISPAEELIIRPATVLEAFGGPPAPRYPTSAVIADTAARWERDSLSWVDRNRRIVHTVDGREVFYDALLLAIGARELPPSPHVRLFRGRGDDDAFVHFVDDVTAGRLERIAFVQQRGAARILPLYELALFTAERARESGRRTEISLVVPDAQPLATLGAGAGTMISDLLVNAGIRLHTDADPVVLSPRRLQLEPDGRDLHPDAIVSLPSLTGPNIRGIPGYAVDRFLHVDEFCRVRHTDRHIYAAGDATDMPIKHGGIGAQQADTAAAGIAHLAGCGPAAEPLHPVVEATLATAEGPRYLSAQLIAGRGWHTQLHVRPPWSTDQKVIAEELSAYLRSADQCAADHSTTPTL